MTVRSLPDARHFQIGALTRCWPSIRVDRFRRPAAEERARDRLDAGDATVCARLFGAPLDLRSPLITGLSLSLLLRADEPWLHAVAGIIAIVSKFLLRIDGKHIWNPAGLPSWCYCCISNGVWISPGQWGTERVVRGLVRRFLRHPGAVRPRAAPTSRLFFLAQPRRAAACARAPGSATRSQFRCISCRAARC